jgi:hypothetical protein
MAFLINAIRENYGDEIDSYEWFEKLNLENENYNFRKSKSHWIGERCPVCKLPSGTCEHVVVKPDDDTLLLKTEVEAEIDEALELIGNSYPIQKNIEGLDVDIHGMQWYRLEQRKSDKIGGVNLSLFSPKDCGWHTCVNLNNSYLIIFGGLRYK